MMSLASVRGSYILCHRRMLACFAKRNQDYKRTRGRSFEADGEGLKRVMHESRVGALVGVQK